jgi:hypothetical protein
LGYQKGQDPLGFAHLWKPVLQGNYAYVLIFKICTIEAKVQPAIIAEAA